MSGTRINGRDRRTIDIPQEAVTYAMRLGIKLDAYRHEHGFLLGMQLELFLRPVRESTQRNEITRAGKHTHTDASSSSLARHG